MIHIFDLDDTLYEEIEYVKSGFRAVAKYGACTFGLSEKKSYQFMSSALVQEGRGAIFDKWLIDNNIFSKKNLTTCIHTYRHHYPKISLNIHAEKLLPALNFYNKYIVTDGHKIVQDLKIKALGISKFFNHVYITHRYGIKHAKPSLRCFELIRKREKCSWDKLVYIGDNPHKDFVSLNKVGVHTVRVHTGSYKNVLAKPGYDAKYSISNLSEILNIF